MRKPVKLSGGRYAKLMGTLWRHKNAQGLNCAAIGLLAKICAWCADQCEPSIPDLELRGLLKGDPNGARMLKQLTGAGRLLKLASGYEPRTEGLFEIYLPPASRKQPANDDAQRAAGVLALLEFLSACRKPVTPTVTGPVTEGVTGPVTGPVMRSTLEMFEENGPSRARAFPQIPDPRSQKREKRENPAPSGAPPPKVRKPRSVDPERDLLDAVVERERLQLELTKLKPLPAETKRLVLSKGREQASKRGCTLEAALSQIAQEALSRHAETGRPLRFMLEDWQPARPRLVVSRGRRMDIPPSCDASDPEIENLPEPEEQWAQFEALGLV